MLRIQDNNDDGGESSLIALLLQQQQQQPEMTVQAAVALFKSLGVQNLLCLMLEEDNDDDDLLRMLLLLPECQTGHSRHRSLFPSHSMSSREEAIYYNTVNILGALCMVLLVALISGLFLGLLTLDVMDLQIVQRTSPDDNERAYATNILPVVQDRHRLLVTLLVVNALAYESLPLFLDALVPSWVAVLMSTTLILLFGEILPSGIFMGPNQLYLGNTFIPAARFFLWALYPVAWPLARWLDCLTETEPHGGEEEYNRGELTALVQIQHERRMRFTMKKDDAAVAPRHRPHHHRPPGYGSTAAAAASSGSAVNGGTTATPGTTWSSLKEEIIEHGREKATSRAQSLDDDDALAAMEQQLHPPLHQREVDMVQGALQMKTLSAMDVYTPYKHVYAAPDSLILDQATITKIYSHGYSRVPVYRYNAADPDDHSAVLGFLITRQLMLIDWDDLRSLSTLPLQRPVCVSPRTNLVDLLEILQSSGLLLTFVCASPMLANKALQANQPIPVEAGLMGIVTLVDLFESILQDRIYDESDIRDRDRAVAVLQQWASAKLQSFLRAYKRKRQKLASNNNNNNQANDDDDDEGAPLLPRGKAEPASGAKYTLPR